MGTEALHSAAATAVAVPSRARIGLAVILFVTLGIPIARLADRSSRIRIIAAGCVFWSLATIATGLATGATTLLLARIAVGIGEAAFTAPAYSLVAAYFAPHRRGIAYAILGLATYFGQIIGQAGGPAIAAKHDWHMAFYVMGAIGVLAGIIALIVIQCGYGNRQQGKLILRSGNAPFGGLHFTVALVQAVHSGLTG